MNRSTSKIQPAMMATYRKKWAGLIFMMAVGLLLTACSKEKEKPANVPQPKCLEYIRQDKSVTLLAKALERLQLDGDILYQQASPTTIFAPTDAAFTSAGLDRAAIERMDTDSLRRLVYAHVLQGRLGSGTVAGFFKLNAICLNKGYQPVLSRNYYGIFLNGNRSQEINELGDGIVHKINGVAFPGDRTLWETIRTHEQLGMLTAAIEMTDVLGSQFRESIKEALTKGDLQPGPYDNTVLAPTDAAFKALGYETVDDLRGISVAELGLLMDSHILSGNQYTADFIGGALFIGRGIKEYQSAPNGLEFSTSRNITHPRIIQSNIKASNGVLHLVDQIILP
ncbi:fasciclin domain-containing protein [Chitinophaga barathri]|uniref:Fasciclin domain-containing protein n=1 Tax=Chitinophaga barathri TaxID=1647451 RepID=A0A3N4M7V8_9BACT|nr:fasciclin domain-containing protein [Chitinophaga barathri]RPD39398.1 fasciclin domain-containing protein [Chitinophaga barathri]